MAQGRSTKIIKMITWTSKLSIKNSLSLALRRAGLKHQGLGFEAHILGFTAWDLGFGVGGWGSRV